MVALFFGLPCRPLIRILPQSCSETNFAIYCVQVEGGFVFGLGMMLQEHIDYSKEGQPLYDSTWDYKIPTAACIPRQFNIALLKVQSHGQLAYIHA